MPIPWIAIGIAVGISLLMTAVNYLLRPHTRKPNSFDSPTYGFSGMSNSYEVGTPINLPYGTIQVPPAIINWYRRGNEGTTRAYILGSLGHGQIAGVRAIKINGQLLSKYYSSFNKDCQVWITHGEYRQKVYKFCKKVKGTISNITTEGEFKTVTITKDTSSRSFQNATADEPGYVLIYNGSDTGNESYEMVRYFSRPTDNSTTTVLKGVRWTKSHVVGDEVEQLYKIEKSESDNVRRVIPHFGQVTTYHQDIDAIELTTSWQNFTTHGKVDAFSLTFDFPEGLYKFDDKEGFESNQVKIGVRWKKTSESSWTTESTDVDVVLSGTENYIKVEKNTNYAILTNASGVDITGLKEDFDYLENIEEGMEIEFSDGSKTYRYVIDKIILEPPGEYTSGELIYRGKIKFKSRKEPSVSKKAKYTGNTVEHATYTIYYFKSVNSNSARIYIPEKPKTIQSSYQVTYLFPRDGRGEQDKLNYDQYDIQVKLISPTSEHNTNKDAHKIVLTSIEDIKMDDLVHPGEALLAMRLTMTEKISGAIDNITAVVDGILVKDTSEDISSLPTWNSVSTSSLTDGNGHPIRIQAYDSAKNCRHAYRLVKTGTKGGTEPTWQPIAGAIIYDGDISAGTNCIWQEDSCKWNDNPLDIMADLQQNKIYGRGQYLDFDNTLLGDLYDSYNVADSNGITDRVYCNHNVTENGRTRDRFAVNINIDFRQPLMDTLEVLAKSFRAYNYWDGKKLLTYIDRYRVPVTMVNNANIVDGSFAIEEVNAEDKINRIYAQILNRDRNYKQDQVGRDYTDEGFSISDLVMEQIHLYGITDKWRATKILEYMLKYSKHINHVCRFEMALDGCLIDIGDVIYLSHEAVNNSVQIGSNKKWQATCGRVIAVSGATFTTDKDVTISNGQKVLLRKTDGTVGTYTIQSQVGRVITVNTTISSVSANSIYSLGTEDSNTEYYRLFTVIAKRFNGYTYEMIGITYSDDVFKDIYDTNVISQEYTGTVKSVLEENDDLRELDSIKDLPPAIPYASVKEDPLVQGEALVYITRPAAGNWAYAEVYYKNIDSEEWSYAGKTSGNPLRVSGLTAGETYEYEVKSFSQLSNSAEGTIHGTFTYGEEAKGLPAVTGLQIANRMGKESNVYGRTFKIRWDDMTSKTKDSLTYAMRKAGYEKLKYYIEVYFPLINSNAKIGNTQVRNMVARYETIDVNKFKYDYEDTMEDISKIFENYSSNAYYNTYYNVPIRDVKFKVYTINDYSQKSEAREITLTNPAPGMYQSDGTTLITPTLKSLKSGIRVSFPHPYDSNGDEEYDISHFMIHISETAGFTTYKKRKVASSVTVNSNDEEIADTSYQEDIKGLDPKKTYYVRIKPFDVFGGGTLSSSASIQPGLNDDDEDEEITAPSTVTGVTFTIQTNGKLKGSWNLLSARDIDEYIYDWRAVKNTSASSPPDLDDVEAGTDGTYDCEGEKKSVKVKDDDETATKNWFVLQPKTGFKYFLRVRAKNTSRKYGTWSSWVTHTGTVEGGTADDMPSKWAMYKFTGSVTAENATQITWVGGTGVLKKKTNSGSTDITINTQATPQTVSGTKYLCYVGTANLALKTESELDADSTYVAIAKCTAAPSGKCKVLMMVSSEHFRISAYEAGFNQLSAVTADVGEVTAGTLTGTTIQTGTSNPKVIIDSSGLRAYNSSGTQRVQISSDGSGWLGSSGALYWDTSGNLTVTGVVADSVAAEDIIAGTITGSTLQTASSGKRFVVTTSTNEAEFYGEESAGGTVTKLATIGITGSAPDYYIGDFGSTSSTNTRAAIRARAYSNTAIVASSNSGTAVDATSSSGYGVFAYSASNYPVSITANTTKAHIHLGGLSSAPSTGSAGDIYYNSTDNKLYCHNGTGWQALF